jgi:Bacterial Ig-like domain
MDEATVEASAAGKPTTFMLKKGSKVIPATVTYTESGTIFKAVLKPTRLLRAGTKYTATVTTAATDAAGNALAVKTWTFKVRS